jgi:hypothetical protein
MIKTTEESDSGDFKRWLNILEAKMWKSLFGYQRFFIMDWWRFKIGT